MKHSAVKTVATKPRFGTMADHATSNTPQAPPHPTDQEHLSIATSNVLPESLLNAPNVDQFSQPPLIIETLNNAKVLLDTEIDVISDEHRTQVHSFKSVISDLVGCTAHLHSSILTTQEHYNDIVKNYAVLESQNSALDSKLAALVAKVQLLKSQPPS